MFRCQGDSMFPTPSHTLPLNNRWSLFRAPPIINLPCIKKPLNFSKDELFSVSAGGLTKVTLPSLVTYSSYSTQYELDNSLSFTLYKI